MALHSFFEKLEYSLGKRSSDDMNTIKTLIHGCADVWKTDTAKDRLGIDYVARLRKGTEIYIDAKTRTAGCSRFWRNGPEIALEKWSVMPGGKYYTPSHLCKAGWTLDESKLAHYILFTFDSQDTDTVFLYPFQLLRMTFTANIKAWMSTYKTDVQDSGSWQSEAVFVPERVVFDAMRYSMTMKVAV